MDAEEKKERIARFKELIKGASEGVNEILTTMGFEGTQIMLVAVKPGLGLAQAGNLTLESQLILSTAVQRELIEVLNDRANAANDKTQAARMATAMLKSDAINEIAKAYLQDVLISLGESNEEPHG